MTQEHAKSARRYDTESWGAGAYEREAGIKGPDDYVRAVVNFARRVVVRPLTLARLLRIDPGSQKHGRF